VRLPKAVVDALELKPGDHIEITVAADRKLSFQIVKNFMNGQILRRERPGLRTHERCGVKYILGGTRAGYPQSVERDTIPSSSWSAVASYCDPPFAFRA